MPERGAEGPVNVAQAEDPTSWCYLYIHNKKVPDFERRVNQDISENDAAGHPGERHACFVHKTPHYTRRGRGGVKEEMLPTISGLVFLQGTPKSVQCYLDRKFPPYHLCKNRSTGKTATIPDAQMQPFMKIMREDPTRIRILENPIDDYAAHNIRLRVLTGTFAGYEGYLIRINRDRKLVVDFGGMAVAIGGIHKESFEEVKELAERMRNNVNKHPIMKLF